MDEFSRQIAFLEEHSEYARRWLQAQPQWREWLRAQGCEKIDAKKVEGLLEVASLDSLNNADEAEFMAHLRLARQCLMLWLAFRDLNGMASLDEVTHSLSHFAQFAVNDCIAFIRKDLQVRFGLPWSQTTSSEMPLMVVGMGNLVVMILIFPRILISFF